MEINLLKNQFFLMRCHRIEAPCQQRTSHYHLTEKLQQLLKILMLLVVLRYQNLG